MNNELQQRLVADLEDTLNHTRWGGNISPLAFRTIYEGHNEHARLSLLATDPVAEESRFNVILAAVRSLAANFTHPETDRVGTGMASVIADAHVFSSNGYKSDGWFEPTVEDLCRNLLRAGAVVGAPEAVRGLVEWFSGRLYFYHDRAAILGVTFVEEISTQGLHVSQLPRSVTELQGAMSTSWLRFSNDEDLLGKVMLSFDVGAIPPLYQPTGEETPSARPAERVSVVHGRLMDFCFAISLVTNHYVAWKYSWSDFGALYLLTRSHSSAYATNEGISIFSPEAPLTKNILEESLQLFGRMQQVWNQELGIAVERWHRSLRPGALADRFIDLRIALESLYLSGGGGMRFQIALCGAWHLGRSAKERRQYYDLLTGAYREASRAVHSGRIENPADRRKQTLLTSAQDACRKGLMRWIKEGRRPSDDALELVLGGAE